MKNLKDKLYVLGTLLVIGLTVVAIVYKNKKPEFNFFNNKEEEKNQSDNNTNNSNTGNNPNSSDSFDNFIEGILQISDDKNKGSFKLFSKFGEIYLKTNKDFNPLVGSNVMVIIDGTIESFRLIDVQKKVESDGFINTQ